jgi:hypothetical protein
VGLKSTAGKAGLLLDISKKNCFWNRCFSTVLEIGQMPAGPGWNENLNIPCGLQGKADLQPEYQLSTLKTHGSIKIQVQMKRTTRQVCGTAVA